MTGRCRLIIGIAVIGIGLGEPAVAQEGTPPSAAPPTASCDAVEPRDAGFFAALAESPQATPAGDGQAERQAGGDATPVSAELPEGEMADEATTAEIVRLYETLIDCLNRGDYLRAYALYADDYLLRNLSAEVLTRLEATPVPVEESTRSEFGGVLEARLLGAGQIAALVTTSNPLSGQVLLRATLTRGEEGLRIAEETVVEAGTPATPIGTASSSFLQVLNVR